MNRKQNRDCLDGTLQKLGEVGPVWYIRLVEEVVHPRLLPEMAAHAHCELGTVRSRVADEHPDFARLRLQQSAQVMNNALAQRYGA